MEHSTFIIRAGDGAQLQVYRWLPPQPRAVVAVLHGIAEHAGRYDPMARYLAAAGYAVYAHDHRGHGLTGPEQGFVAARDGWRRLLDDAGAVLDHAAARHPALPRVLIGHSMGSLLAQHFAIERGAELAALVLSATTFRPDPMPVLGAGLARLIGRIKGPRHPSPLLDFLALGVLRYRLKSRRTSCDWLNRDPAEVDAYIADPHCGFVPSVSLWGEVCRGTRFVGRRHHQARLPSTLPVLLQAGGDDVLSAGGRQVRELAERYRQLGLQDVDCRIYPGARHEIYKEQNRNEILADLVAWLDKRLPTAVDRAAGE